MSQPKNYVMTGRIRSIKPEFFTHEKLFDAERESGLPLRICYAGLWTRCDREGRFKWEPRRLKLAIAPYDDCDFSRVLDALTTRGFIVRYEVEGNVYGWVPSFLTHQSPNNKEQFSNFPAPDDQAIEKAQLQQDLPGMDTTRKSRVNHASATPLMPESGEGKGREGNTDSSILTNTTVSTEQKTPAFALLQQDGKTFPISASQVADFERAYPGMDVQQELRSMAMWLVANPKKRKKKTGMMKFVVGWLKRESKTDKSKTVPFEKRDYRAGRAANEDGSLKL